jgi:RimJ/RimL family protein N-acetyltransferase
MIYGKRIRFRSPEREDLPIFVNWINDPEVRVGLSLFLPISMAQEEGWFEEVLKRPVEEQPLTIEVNEKGNWIPIGNVGLFNIDPIVRSAEVGIMIGNKDYWDKGYGTEAMQLILKHGFEILNMNRIFLRVYENNPRAIRCYEKTGFFNEGRMRQAMYTEGKYFDILLFSVLREEWNNEAEEPNNKDHREDLT